MALQCPRLLCAKIERNLMKGSGDTLKNSVFWTIFDLVTTILENNN